MKERIATLPPSTINQLAIDGQPVFCDNYFGVWTRAKITVLYAAVSAARCIMKTANPLVWILDRWEWCPIRVYIYIYILVLCYLKTISRACFIKKQVIFNYSKIVSFINLLKLRCI